MHIKIKRIKIEGFNSIEVADIDFESRGTVLVKGINEYEDGSQSNGSGKSSCFEAITWCIYGKTSSGISDPSNRYLGRGCSVELYFSVEDQEYRIERSIKNPDKGTSLNIFKNNGNISGRNKTDTEKIIKSDIIPISMEIYLSTIFLSQGFSGRLSVLTPSGRKERIESITNTVSIINEFKKKLDNSKKYYENSISETQSSISYNNGIISSNIEMSERLMRDILEAEKDVPDGNIEELEEKLSKFNGMYVNINNALEGKKENRYNIKSSIDNRKRDIIKYKKEISEIDRSMNSLEESVCPTCGQVVSNKDNMLEKFSNKKKDLERNISESIPEIEYLQKQLDEVNNTIIVLEKKESNLYKRVESIRSLILEISKKKDTSSDRERIEKLNKDIDKRREDNENLNEELASYEIYKNIANHCLQLVTKQFRGYLLKNTIDFMNERLLSYSEMLFSNDTISLAVDNSKLDIYLGDSLYESLSGGEKRRVDLAIVLAQRDMAVNIAGVSCNILVLDEITDNLDELGISKVMNMFSEVSSEIESMFVISHKPSVEIPYDSMMTVVKNSDRISKIRIS